jgi:hypothetical protein
MRRLIFPDLAIQIVRGEERVEEGPRQSRVHPAVDDAMLLVLVAEEAVFAQGADVLELFIGGNDQRPRWFRRTVELELVQEFGKGSIEGVALEADIAIDLVAPLFLRRTHGAGAAMRRVGEGEDIPRIGGDRDGDVAGKVLRSIEADQTVDADFLGSAGSRSEMGLCRQGLPSEPIYPIEDGAAGAVEKARYGTDARR